MKALILNTFFILQQLENLYNVSFLTSIKIYNARF